MALNGTPPNFLFILVDQERFPPVYETPELKVFRQEQLAAQTAISQYAVSFNRHYAASTACAPSRTSLFTGHYPSLHGVSQTDGLFKYPHDPDMFWLEPGSIPTLGNYFRAAGYQTYYKGKWHISEASLEDAGHTGDAAIWAEDGSQSPESIEKYVQADPLDAYGFSGWIGPEPHGKSKYNTGVNRDAGFAQQTVDLLDRLEEAHRAGQTAPWLVVSSFVNPHDIVLFGMLWSTFKYRSIDDSIPDIPSAPTRREDLSSKPACQQSYVSAYGKMFIPQPTIKLYRRFYYHLQKLVDQHINTIYERLKRSIFFENTIVIFSSDHGEMLGAHGGMQQKWHNAYEESLHVPLMISNPLLFSKPASVDMLTSHVDLLPTLLGLAGLDAEYLRTRLRGTHSQPEPLVGRDLSQVVLGKGPLPASPIYFMTDDEISEGQNHRRFRVRFRPISQPNHVETVIADLPTGDGGQSQLWKYSRYFDNPQFWTAPNAHDDVKGRRGVKVKTAPLPDEFEMYNLNVDPLEKSNLAQTSNNEPEGMATRQKLESLLAEQRSLKRLTAEHG